MKGNDCEEKFLRMFRLKLTLSGKKISGKIDGNIVYDYE